MPAKCKHRLPSARAQGHSSAVPRRYSQLPLRNIVASLLLERRYQPRPPPASRDTYVGFMRGCVPDLSVGAVGEPRCRATLRHNPSDSLTNDQPEQDQQLMMRLRTKCSGGFQPIQSAGARKNPQRHVARLHAMSRHHRDPTRPRQIVNTTSARCTRSAECQTTANNHPTDVPFRKSPSLPMAATRWNR